MSTTEIDPKVKSILDTMEESGETSDHLIDELTQALKGWNGGRHYTDSQRREMAMIFSVFYTDKQREERNLHTYSIDELKIGYYLRNEADALYESANYRDAIHKSTQALDDLENVHSSCKSDMRGALLSNRATCFLAMGACEAAIKDSVLALPFVSRLDVDKLDSGYVCKIKLHICHGQALLKSGDHVGSTHAFDAAIRIADYANRVVSQDVQSTIASLKAEATSGKEKANSLGHLMQEVSYYTNLHKFQDALVLVNKALEISNQSPTLFKSKVSLLCCMKRWSEASGFCERLAASNTQLDGIFTMANLESLDPFPGAGIARTLNAHFFDGEPDETASNLKLPTDAVTEAAVRLHPSLLPSYLRALRLEERYTDADAAIEALEQTPHRSVKWFQDEKCKVAQTKNHCATGDETHSDPVQKNENDAQLI